MRLLPQPIVVGAILFLIAGSVAVSQVPPLGGEQGAVSGGAATEIGGAAAAFQAMNGSAPTLPQVGSAGEVIGFSHLDGRGTQTITLVHTGKSWMAVYHIDSSGTVRLVSSRPIDADFSLQLNATSPLPEEIRQFGKR